MTTILQGLFSNVRKRHDLSEVGYLLNVCYPVTATSKRSNSFFFAMKFYTEHIGCAVACLFRSDFFVYIFSFDFYKSRCNCYIADSIFTYVLYVCKTFFKKKKNIFSYANRLRTTLFILRRNFLYNI